MGIIREDTNIKVNRHGELSDRGVTVGVISVCVRVLFLSKSVLLHVKLIEGGEITRKFF